MKFLGHIDDRLGQLVTEVAQSYSQDPAREELEDLRQAIGVPVAGTPIGHTREYYGCDLSRALQRHLESQLQQSRERRGW